MLQICIEGTAMNGGPKLDNVNQTHQILAIGKHACNRNIALMDGQGAPVVYFVTKVYHLLK